jgi:hypothetical protein
MPYKKVSDIYTQVYAIHEEHDKFHFYPAKTGLF